MSVRSLSEKVGVTPPTMASYESGKSTPTVDTLAKIAEALGIQFFEINEYRFTITRKEKLAQIRGEQIALDFTGEYAFSKATVRLSPGKINLSFDGITPMPLLRVS